jgi:sulfoxide reductase heme-binding subunit YedZ
MWRRHDNTSLKLSFLPVKSPRSSSARFDRRLRHHLVLAAASTALGLLIAPLHGTADLREQVSIATAYIGLTWVAASLLLGPLNLLRGRPNPVSTDLRRDIGIWGGIAGLAHLAVGLTVHMRGKMAEYFLAPARSGGFPVRIDAFGLANHMGLMSGLILLALVVLSSDWTLRRLGAARWKRWQRWNYVCAAALVAHGALYQLLEKRRFVLVAAFVLIAAVATSAQMAGVGVRRRARGRQIDAQSLGEADQL